MGGCEIGLQVAVDFTQSNDNVTPSLHQTFDIEQNQYYKTLEQTGMILENYDSDKMIPIFGFGGRLSDYTEVDHYFALNGDMRNPEVKEFKGMLECYRNTILHGKIEKWGPTHFEQVLKEINDISEEQSTEINQKNQKYWIQLILTDGSINDYQRTVDEVVRASKLPLSIIIVGIGSPPDDFATMKKLDADNHALKSAKYGPQTRDAVQFVAIEEH